MNLILRPYQKEAVDAVHSYLCRHKDKNPCVCMACASGKSVTMAACIRKWKETMPWVRACILAHRKELVQQNHEKLVSIAPDLNVGIFSAALGRKDWDAPVLYASIDSIYKHAGKFPPWNVIFVDEAHRIPPSGEGRYRRFIVESKQFNAKLRVVGWTATPFRMTTGAICHRDHILNEICYETDMRKLMDDGYLCRLRSKCGVIQPDLTNVKKASKGDYVITSLSKEVAKRNLVQDAVEEVSHILRKEHRKATIVFCVDVAHCQLVCQEFLKHGYKAAIVTGKTLTDERDKIIKLFLNGRIEILCNVQIATEGLDVPRIDSIVLLRPTMSPGLYSQMVGRGLRLHASKEDCIVIDMAHCIEEHGPIDILGSPYVALATCGSCREVFSRAVRSCPQCGWEIPKMTMESLEQSERARRMHDRKASERSILSTDPETYQVDEVFVDRHRKEGQPDSVCLTFRCGCKMFRYWLCLDHPDLAGQLAQSWYRKYFAGHKRKSVSVDSVVNNLFFPQEVKEEIHTITVVRDGKYDKVIGFNNEHQ